MKKYIFHFSFLLITGILLASPQDFKFSLVKGTDRTAILRFTMPRAGYINADSLEFSWGEQGYGVPQIIAAPGEPEYVAGTELTLALPPESQPEASPLFLTIVFQACEDNICYMPQEVTVSLDSTASHASTTTPQAPTDKILRSHSGYLPPDKFLQWLEMSDNDSGSLLDRTLNRLRNNFGMLIICLLLLPLGFLLNLTPCVLPMIPLNLAILSAAAPDRSRRHGAQLGTAFGLSQALAYGLLGTIVVLTGTRFGQINSNPWFNLAIAAIFLLLGLALWDIIIVDLTRFRPQTGKLRREGHPFLLAISLGIISALLASACVAPVLIWVLILSADLYSRGNFLALFLPVLLGLGLGAPWPFLGAGFSFLPKPGPWMNRLKHAFGLLIIAVAAYYICQAYRNFLPSPATSLPQEWVAITGTIPIPDGEHPQLLYFWGNSCKSCDLLKHRTFQDPEVRARLRQYQCLAIQADDPNNAELCQKFAILGLPTLIIPAP